MHTNTRRFQLVFPRKHVVLPVVHVESQEQSIRNVAIASNADADGVFLINHSISADELLEIHGYLASMFPSLWIGVNCLGLSAAETVRSINSSVSGVWTDNAIIDEREEEQPFAREVQDIIRDTKWPGLYFGGVAFKYQRQVEDLQAAARIASRYMDVVTTTGVYNAIA